jgi:hypothetical protein
MKAALKEYKECLELQVTSESGHFKITSDNIGWARKLHR